MQKNIEDITSRDTSTPNCPDQENVSPLFFDKSDYDLLRMVNDVYTRKTYPEQKKLLTPHLHPHGIKEMAAPRAQRIAYSVIQLLESLESGERQDRISALGSLRDEVLYTSHGHMRINTARVLVEIMKNLVRSHGDCRRQLELARDFAMVSLGKPRKVRSELKKYHLLEMPEEWNQVAFDEHVHDVNTTGRKSPTHLIMDAWIKGIRRLTVIYYNHVPREAAEELLQAASIMDIKVMVGIEFTVKLRDKPVRMVWVPRGFSDSGGFIDFLRSPRIRQFMDQGREISSLTRSYVLRLLHSFNRNHLPAINQEMGLELAPLDENSFLKSVGQGQVSVHHLGKYIHELISAELAAQKGRSYQEQSPVPSGEPGDVVQEPDIYDIIENYLRGSQNPDVPDIFEAEDPPELLTLTPEELAEKLKSLHANSNITLNLCDLKVEDVIEILFDCKGMITHLEILNLKNQVLGREHDKERIINLQNAINAGNVIKLKKYLGELVREAEERQSLDSSRRDKLVEILCDISTLQSFYQNRPLYGCIGSDSTGRSGRVYGMGLILSESLPRSARRQLTGGRNNAHQRLDVGIKSLTQDTYIPKTRYNFLSAGVSRFLKKIPALNRLEYQRVREWIVQDYYSLSPDKSNIFTLGGVHSPGEDGPGGRQNGPRRTRGLASLKYLNTRIKIASKIGIGFIPAFLTFLLTHEWWILMYFGAVIWFGITGVRNVIQSVLGCGGINRPSLAKWSTFVSWDRFADSLMYTGFSVPLLDFILKTLILDQGFGATVATHPVIVYATISLVNGMYLSTHNYFRGLPRAAVIGNFFRSLLAIPLALVFNWAAGGILAFMGVAAVDRILQQWATIISKLASDTVAGIIEGFADRALYIRRRIMDYRRKLQHLFDTYAQLEMLFPMDDVLDLLESTRELMLTIEYEKRDMVNIIIVNALDLMYFWMYQPRAKGVLKLLLKQMTREERKVFLLSQHVLFRQKRISRLLVDGLVGKNFARALSFYLDHWREYLEEIEYQANKYPPLQEDMHKYSMLESLYHPAAGNIHRPPDYL